jgi:hypothetical protein
VESRPKMIVRMIRRRRMGHESEGEQSWGINRRREEERKGY